MRKKVLLTATVQSHIAQFHKPLIKLLKEKNCEVHIAARNNLAEKNGLKIDDADRIFDIPFDRSPFSKKNIQAYKQLKKLIDTEKYDIISCNTPMGGVVTRLAAKAIRKKGTTVIYTAHGFHFYKGAPLKNWLFYYPIEKWLSRYTDKIIAITNEDFKFASKKFCNTKIEYMHGVGVNSEKFFPISEGEKILLRNKYHINLEKFVCLCTGELNKNKNQSELIDITVQIVKKYPQFLLLLAGNGKEEESLKSQIVDLKIEEHVKMLGYTTMIREYVQCSDMAVSASLREGLPLNIIEAMLCEKPVVASVNRGHRELVDDKITGFLVSSKSEFENAICSIIENHHLREKLGKNGFQKAQLFALKNTKKELEKIYSEVL